MTSGPPGGQSERGGLRSARPIPKDASQPAYSTGTDQTSVTRPEHQAQANQNCCKSQHYPRPPIRNRIRRRSRPALAIPFSRPFFGPPEPERLELTTMTPALAPPPSLRVLLTRSASQKL
jgi:hypothetical protein